ncbi:hypothetical protein O0L34_g5909 [Tuta absoluta]|nr:hypothetical protein O0L34_g5909 [Tuta absoluta]
MRKILIYLYLVFFKNTNVLAGPIADPFLKVASVTIPIKGLAALGHDAMLFITNPDDSVPDRWDSLSAIKLILERLQTTKSESSKFLNQEEESTVKHLNFSDNTPMLPVFVSVPVAIDNIPDLFDDTPVTLSIDENAVTFSTDENTMLTFSIDENAKLPRIT